MNAKRLTYLSSMMMATAMLTACGGSSEPGVLSSAFTTPTNQNQQGTGTQNQNQGTPTTPSNPNQGAPTTPTNPNQNITPAPANPQVFGLDALGYRSQVQAELVEEYGRSVSISSLSLNIDGKNYNNAEGINLTNLGATNSSFKPLTVVEKATGSVGSESGTVERRNTIYLFKQDYSVIAQIQGDKVIMQDPSGRREETLTSADDVVMIKGQATDTLPTTGQFEYKGVYKQARSTSVGSISYNVDFAAKQGSGVISASGGDLTLESASIARISHTNETDRSRVEGHGIRGDAIAPNMMGLRGDYELGFFGPNAEEIVGHVDFGVFEGSFGAKR